MIIPTFHTHVYYTDQTDICTFLVTDANQSLCNAEKTFDSSTPWTLVKLSFKLQARYSYLS